MARNPVPAQDEYVSQRLRDSRASEAPNGAEYCVQGKSTLCLLRRGLSIPEARDLSVIFYMYILKVSHHVENTFFLQMQRLPVLPSSNLGLEILMGRDETIDFDDFLNSTHLFIFKSDSLEWEGSASQHRYLSI